MMKKLLSLGIAVAMVFSIGVSRFVLAEEILEDDEYIEEQIQEVPDTEIETETDTEDEQEVPDTGIDEDEFTDVDTGAIDETPDEEEENNNSTSSSTGGTGTSSGGSTTAAGNGNTILGGGGTGAPSDYDDDYDYYDDDYEYEDIILEVEPSLEIMPYVLTDEDFIRKATEKFLDVSYDDWFTASIGFLAEKSIITGDDFGNVNPNANISRADFLIMIMRAYEIELNADLSDNFADVKIDDYYAGYLAKAKAMGIITGDDCGNSNALSQLTREDMCTLLYRVQFALGKLPQVTLPVEIPGMDQVSDYAKTSVETYIKAGILRGMDGHVGATNYCTRAQVAQMLYNLLK